MTSFLKKKNFLAFPLMIFVIVAVFYFFGLSKRNNYSSALISVPENSYFTLVIEDVKFLVNDLTDNQMLIALFSKELSAVKLDQIKKISIALSDNSFFNKKLKDSKLLISFVPNENDFDFLFSLELSSSAKFSSFMSNLNEIKFDLGIDQISQIKGSNEFQFYSNSNSNLVFGFYINNTLLLSENSNLIKEAAKRMQDVNISIPEHWNNYSSSSNYKIYYKADNLKQFFSLYLNENLIRFELIPDNSVADIFFNDTSINFKFYEFDKEFKIRDFDPNLFSDVVAKIQHFSFVGFSDLSTTDFNNNEGLLNNQFVEVLFDLEPNEEAFPLIKIFKIINLKDFQKFLNENSLKQRKIDFKLSIPDSIKIGVLNNQLFKSSYFVFNSELEYYVIHNNFFFVTSELSTFEKFFSCFELENVESNYSIDLQNNTFARYNLTGFYPLILASTNDNKKDVFRDNFNFISSLYRWDFKYEKDNSLVLEISYDSLAVFKYLENKVNFILNRHLSFNIDSLLEFANQQDSIKEGRQIFNFEDGKIKAIGFFKNGLATGLWRFYFPNGNINAVVEFVDNQANGKCIVYSEYTDALMHISCSFENGKLHNQFVEFHKNGRPLLVVTYRKGEISSRLRFFYWQSTIFAEAEIGEGRKLTNIKYYSLNGDFIDINNLSTASNILVNYETFIRKFNR